MSDQTELEKLVERYAYVSEHIDELNTEETAQRINEILDFRISVNDTTRYFERFFISIEELEEYEKELENE